MTPARKKKLTYFTIGMFFLLGGIEYAVILPTLWLYLQERFCAQPYFLGLVLSAFSFTGLFAGPIMGRWSDKTKKTKYILLFANLWEVAGNIMYFLGLNKYFILASRLVAGVGTGVGAAIIADISRVTNTEERTAVLSLFMAVRQFGLLLGPGLNVFLRELHFFIGPFVVDKYTSPGVFMALMWILLEILVIFLYFDLHLLKDQVETKEQINYGYHDSYEQGAQNLAPSPAFETSPSHSINSDEAVPAPRTGSSSGRSSTPKIIRRTPPSSFQDRVRQRQSPAGFATASSEMIVTIEKIMSSSAPRSGPVLRHVSEESTHGSIGLDRRHSPSQGQAQNYNSFENPGRDFANSLQRARDSEEWEVLDNQDTGVNNVTYTAPKFYIGDDTQTNIYGSEGPRSYDAQEHSSQLYHQVSPTTPESQQNEVEVTQEKRPWRYYFDEYVREEIIVILAGAFVGNFNQVSLETMVTPLTEKLLDWRELENSILYCAGGVEVIIAFIFIRFLSKRFEDRTLLVFGFVLEMAAVGWLLYFLPTAQPHDPGYNLPRLIVGVVLDLFGLPFLIVCSTSLYSKVTRAETQGFSQGLRRTVCGIAFIMGPLWTGGMLNRPYILVGVMLGLMALVLIMFLLSYKYMAHRPVTVETAQSGTNSITNPGNRRDRSTNSITNPGNRRDRSNTRRNESRRGTSSTELEKNQNEREDDERRPLLS